MERARLFCGASRQAFQLSAIMRAVRETEAEMAEKKDRRKGDARAEHGSGAAPRGLGLSFLRAPEAAPPPRAEPPVAVYVNGSGKQTADSLVDGLADYVATGSAYERESRIRTAQDVLTAHAKTSEERRALTRHLEDEVAARIPEKPGELDLLRRGTAKALDTIKGILNS